MAQSDACFSVHTIALARSLGLVVRSIRSPMARFSGRLGGNGKFSNPCYRKKGETLVVKFVQVLSISSRISVSVAQLSCA
jgi:hypothetical protein